MSSRAARVADSAEAFLSAVLDFDAPSAPVRECVVVAAIAARVEKAASALHAIASARAVAGGAHKEAGVQDPARWVARHAGTTSRQAKEMLSAAASLEAFPATKDALLAGDVSLSQAQEIAKAAAERPAEEDSLLEVAKAGDLTALRDEIRERRLHSLSAEELHQRQHASRRFRHWRDGLGMICFDGALPPETGIPFVTRIGREAAALQRAARRNGSSERFECHAADALVALGAESGSGRRGASTDLVVVCDMYAWRRGHTHDGEPCHVIGGGPIPVDVAKSLAEDAFLKIVLHDGKAIQRIKHVGRRYTAELLTALDLGPVPSFSGRACVRCKQSWGLQRDHAEPVAHAGPTSIDNLQDLCYLCHSEKTEQDRTAGLLGPRARARGAGPPRRASQATRARPGQDRRTRARTGSDPPGA